MKVLYNFFILFVTIKLPRIWADVSDKEYALMPTLFHFDNYDECMLGKHALYCSLTIQLFPQNTTNPSKIWNLIKEVSSDNRNFRHDLLRHEICASKILNLHRRGEITNIKTQLEQFYEEKFSDTINTRCEIRSIRCQSRESPYTVDFYDVVFGIFIIVYVSLVLLGSIYEEIVRRRGEAKFEDFAQSFMGKCIKPFSLTRNWSRLTKINQNEPSLRCIQGIRFFNMLIVINGHTVIANMSAPVSNPIIIENMKYKSSYLLLGVGKFVNLTYFMISSWLLTYHFLLALETRQITFKNLILMVVHRYIRLTPSLAFVVALQSTWFVHLARGPRWDEVVGRHYRSCRENWWITLLYLNSYTDPSRRCIPQSWYTSVDTHYYVLNLFLLWFLRNGKNKIFYVHLCMMICHLGYLFSVYYWSEWDFKGFHQPEANFNRAYLKSSMWIKTGCSTFANLVGLVAGLGFGYLYYKNRNRSLSVGRILLLLWWILIFVLPLTSMFFPAFIPLNSELVSALYNSISRFVFIFGIGLGVFGLTQGLGLAIKRVCEWPPPYILGRLTYSAYLVHIFLTHLREGTKRKPIHLSIYFMLMESIGNIVVTYIGAAILTLFIELPVSALQKLLLPKDGQDRKRLRSRKCEKVM